MLPPRAPRKGQPGMTPAPGDRRIKGGFLLPELSRKNVWSPTRAPAAGSWAGWGETSPHGRVGTEGWAVGAVGGVSGQQRGLPGPGHLPASSPR